MAYQVRKASYGFNRFLRIVLGTYLRLRYNITYDASDIQDLKPPFILLANHANNWDPFMLSIAIPHPIYFVASDSFFRTPVMRYLFGLVGGIPKTKFMSDIQTVKQMLLVKKWGGIIGVFPEGSRNWDGSPLPILPTTAKMLKSFALPVVAVTLEGSYLSQPRWARNVRRGKMHIRYIRLFDADTVRGMTTDAIHSAVTRVLDVDDNAGQATHPMAFSGRRLAERLERLLYLCPGCGATHAMSSSGNRLFCTHCGQSSQLDSHGILTSAPKIRQRETVHARHVWQTHLFFKLIHAACVAAEPNRILLEEPCTTLYTVQPFEKPCRLDEGHLRLYHDRVELEGRIGLHSIPIDRVEGMNVAQSHIPEFHADGTMYRLRFKSPHASAVKWEMAVWSAQYAQNPAAAVETPPVSSPSILGNLQETQTVRRAATTGIALERTENLTH